MWVFDSHRIFRCERNRLLFSERWASRSATYLCDEQLSYISLSRRFGGSSCGETFRDDPDFSYSPRWGTSFFQPCFLSWSLVSSTIFSRFSFISLVGSEMLILGCSCFPSRRLSHPGCGELSKASLLNKGLDLPFQVHTFVCVVVMVVVEMTELPIVLLVWVRSHF